MTIRETVRNFHHKQYDLTALAEENNEILGYCDYCLFNNTIDIQMIKVEPSYRKQGIATKLLNFVHKEYADKKINYGYTTDDGAPFLKKYLEKKPVLENLDQAIKILKENDLDETAPNFVKLKNALKDSLGYLGTFTKFLTQDTGAVELINFYNNEIKAHPQYISFLKHPIIEYKNFELLLDDWMSAKLSYAAKTVLKMFYKDFATKSINDSDFRSYAQRFLSLPQEKQKMFLKTQKHYKENNVSIDKFYKDFYEFIDASGKTKDEIHQEVLSMKKTNKLKVLIDTSDCLVIQTNDKNVIQKFGSQSWCIVYSDSYYKQYVDYNIQFLIFNYTVPLSSADALYGVTISLNTFEPIHGGSQNKLNEDIPLRTIEKNCKIQEGYLENYVSAIASNLNKEVDQNYEDFPKLFKKYKDSKEILHFISERIKTKFKNVSLSQHEALAYISNLVTKAHAANIDLTEVIDENSLSKNLNFKLTLQEATQYQKMLYALIDSTFNIKYQVLFHEDAVFASFMHHLEKNVSKNRYDRFVTHFLNYLTLEKLNALNVDNFNFAMVSVKSNVKEVLTRPINNFPNLINHVREFLKKDHEHLAYFTTDFILKNQKLLELSDVEVVKCICEIFKAEENLEHYSKDLKKIETLKDASFAMDVRRKVAFAYFRTDSSYQELRIDENNATEYCKIFIDAYNLKVVDHKALKTMVSLDNLIGKFIVRQKQFKIENELREQFENILEILDFTTKNILKMCYRYASSQSETEIRMMLAAKLLKSKKYNFETDEDIGFEEQFVLDVIVTKNEEFEVKSTDLAKISKKLDLLYNTSEKAFEYRMPNLNRLRDIIVYDKDYEISLDHKEGDKAGVANVNDYDSYMIDVNSSNKKLLQSKDNKQQIVLDAIDIAISDMLYSQLVNAVFNKMFESGYFKKWSTGQKYKIEANSYVILVTDKFIKPAMLKGLIKRGRIYQHLDIAFASTLEVIENSSNFIKLEETDFEAKYDIKHFNNILKNLLT